MNCPDPADTRPIGEELRCPNSAEHTEFYFHYVPGRSTWNRFQVRRGNRG